MELAGILRVGRRCTECFRSLKHRRKKNTSVDDKKEKKTLTTTLCLKVVTHIARFGREF